MARPNYSFAKRQREMAKKKKKEEKRLRKQGGTARPAREEPQPTVLTIPTTDTKTE